MGLTGELARESRLAHSVAATHGDEPTATGTRTLPALAQPRHLVVAADQRRRGGDIELARKLDRCELQRGIVAQDGLVQSAKIGAGFHADLLHQQAPRIAKRLQRLGLAPTAIQREHALRVQALAQRVLGQQALDLAEDLLMAPRAQVRVDGQLGGRLAQLLEPADLGGGERLIGQIGERGSSEEAQRLARRVGWLARRRRASRLGHEPLEAERRPPAPDRCAARSRARACKSPHRHQRPAALRKRQT